MDGFEIRTQISCWFPCFFFYSVPQSFQPSFSYVWLENGLSLNILHFLCCKWSTTFQTCSSCIINHFSYLEDRMHWNVLPSVFLHGFSRVMIKHCRLFHLQLFVPLVWRQTQEKISIITYLSNQLLQYACLWSLHLNKMCPCCDQKRLVFLLM